MNLIKWIIIVCGYLLLIFPYTILIDKLPTTPSYMITSWCYGVMISIVLIRLFEGFSKWFNSKLK